MTLRSVSRHVSIALALASLPAQAEQPPAKEADARTRSVERATGEIHKKLRDARAGRDAARLALLNDLLKQAGATLRRATAARAEVLAMIADGRDPKSRLAELSFLDARSRFLLRTAESLDGSWVAAPEATTVTVREIPLPAEPQP